jgi:hypothetical protein
MEGIALLIRVRFMIFRFLALLLGMRFNTAHTFIESICFASKISSIS